MYYIDRGVGCQRETEISFFAVFRLRLPKGAKKDISVSCRGSSNPWNATRYLQTFGCAFRKAQKKTSLFPVRVLRTRGMLPVICRLQAAPSERRKKDISVSCRGSSNPWNVCRLFHSGKSSVPFSCEASTTCGSFRNAVNSLIISWPRFSSRR